MTTTKGHEVRNLRCPSCMHKSVTGRTNATVGCTVCKKWWVTYTLYIQVMSDAGLIPDEDTEPVDYINSGDLQGDIAELIATVGERAEVELLDALIGWIPRLDQSGEGTVHIDDLVRALKDLKAGRWSQRGVK